MGLGSALVLLFVFIMFGAMLIVVLAHPSQDDLFDDEDDEDDL